MLIFKLEKNIILYKNQFEKFLLEMFGEHKLDRLSLDIDGLLFRIKYMVKHQKDLDQIPKLKELFIDKSLELRTIFGEFLSTFLINIIKAPDLYTEKIETGGPLFEDILAQDVKIDSVYVKFKMVLLSQYKEYLTYIDDTIQEEEPFNLFPKEYFRFYTDSYNDGIAKAYPELFEQRQQDKIGVGDDAEVFVHNFTFQTSERCSLNCFPEGTDILMSDFSSKDIKDIKIGDEVLGFEEYNDFYKQRSLIKTKVLATSSHYESLYKISHPMIKDTYVTPEHPFWTARGEWVMVKDIRPSDGLMITTFDVNDFFDVNTNSIDYIHGYFLSGFLGDGFVSNRVYIHKNTGKKYNSSRMRFVVKDEEMNDRMLEYANILGFNFNISPFKISEKYDLYRDALNSSNRIERAKWDKIYYYYFTDERAKLENMSPEFLMGFMAGLYDAEGHIDGTCIRMFNSDRRYLDVVEKGLRYLNIKFDYDKPRIGVNKVVYTLRILGGSLVAIKWLKSIKNAITRKGLNNFIGKSLFVRIDGYKIEYIRNAKKVYNFETTEHTYIANRLQVHNCSYCYQFNKTPMRMEFETAKKFIDHLLNDDYGYINRYNSPAIIIEFIGGEPLLEIHLTRKIYEYFLDRCYELNHPWFTLHRLSICSNGLQYFDEPVQDFFKAYAHNISFNISIDGNKALHDACRIQPNGEGSYDIDMMALNHFNKHYTPERNSKMTLAPSNIKYLYDSVVDFIQNGMTCINLNCVFEEGWNQETARIEYYQLKKLADYLIDHHLEHLYIAIFNERQEDMQSKSSDGNSCGGTGSMLALRPNGQFYPCIRYMPTSVGDNVKDLCIGNVDHGIIGREQGSEVLQMMDQITRRSQTNDICFECPISNDCMSCSALSHTVFGTPNKRTTFACIQMLAEALANVYYWNRLLLKHPEYDLHVRKNVLPDEWSLLVIDEDELEDLKLLEALAMIKRLESNEVIIHA